jgi:uncharacterized protein (DUF2252 family)
VRNLGAFGTAEGHLVFDINDFDETTRGPFEWDLLRFAASLRLAGEEAGSGNGVDEAVVAFGRAWRKSIDAYARMPFVEVLRNEVRRITSQPIHRVLLKAERALPQRQLRRLAAQQAPGEWRFVSRPPLFRSVSRDRRDAVIASLASYGQTLSCDHRLALDRYRAVDVAFKVVGTGSVGMRDYVVLCQGASLEDVLLLQVKEAGPSCYEPSLGRQTDHHGQRVAEGQRLMQRASDPFLGWTEVEGRPFLVRQLCDHKASIEPGELCGRALLEYAVVAGEVFARAHARTGSAAALGGYAGRGGRFDAALAGFARAYAEQTHHDHARFQAAIRAGRLPAEGP